MNGSPGELLAVGRIARAHGIRGEVAVQPLTDVPERFAARSVLLLGPDGERRLTVRSSRPHQGRMLVLFEEVPDRTEAEALRGRLLLVPAAQAPPLPEGEYWVHQVVGLTVVTEDGREVGVVREVLRNPANDVWVVEGARGDVLVPAIREVVASVDPAGRRVVIREVPGLLAPGKDSPPPASKSS